MKSGRFFNKKPDAAHRVMKSTTQLTAPTGEPVGFSPHIYDHQRAQLLSSCKQDSRRPCRELI